MHLVDFVYNFLQCVCVREQSPKDDQRLPSQLAPHKVDQNSYLHRIVRLKTCRCWTWRQHQLQAMLQGGQHSCGAAWVGRVGRVGWVGWVGEFVRFWCTNWYTLGSLQAMTWRSPPSWSFNLGLVICVSSPMAEVDSLSQLPTCHNGQMVVKISRKSHGDPCFSWILCAYDLVYSFPKKWYKTTRRSCIDTRKKRTWNLQCHVRPNPSCGWKWLWFRMTNVEPQGLMAISQLPFLGSKKRCQGEGLSTWKAPAAALASRRELPGHRCSRALGWLPGWLVTIGGCCWSRVDLTSCCLQIF